MTRQWEQTMFFRLPNRESRVTPGGMAPLLTRAQALRVSAPWPRAKFILSACKAVEGREPTRRTGSYPPPRRQLRAFLCCAPREQRISGIQGVFFVYFPAPRIRSTA